MVRYHSFYPWHSAGAYHWMMNEHDKKMLDATRAFNPYDLYSKSDDNPSVEELKVRLFVVFGVLSDILQGYYMELIDEYFPNKIIKW